MPIFIKDYEWHETLTEIHITMSLRNCNPSRVSVSNSRVYLKISFPPFIFEAFFPAAVDINRSFTQVGNGIIETTLYKGYPELWEKLTLSDLDKTEIIRRRKEAEEEIKQEQEKKITEKNECKQKQHSYSVNQQLEVEDEERERIQKLKDNEKKLVNKQMEKWRVLSPSDKQTTSSIRHSTEVVTYKISENSKNDGSIWDDNEFENTKVERKVETSQKKNVSSQIPLKPNRLKKEKTQLLPPPRTTGKIAVDFTPRAFPTAARESQAHEEEEWLRKQAEARRITENDFEDLAKEERDPDWLKDKGDSLFKTGNYQAAVNAYSLAIRLNKLIPAVYSNRAACHLKLNNLHKAIEDSSKALELLIPAVSGNAAARLKSHVRRGIAFCRLELYVEGLQDLEAALKIDPNNENLKKDAEAVRKIIQNPSSDSLPSLAKDV